MKATLSSLAGVVVDSDPGSHQAFSLFGGISPSRIRGVSIVVLQEHFVQVALFAAFELSALSPAADRFPAVFFPMVLAELARDGGSRAL